MKALLTFLILTFTFTVIKAQDESVEGELAIWVKNNPQLKLVSMTLELLSPACWDGDHYITELFNGGTEGDYINDGWIEFLVCWETFPEEYYRTFGLGLYKITAKVNGVVKDHFFIDYRTSDLPEAIDPWCTIDYALDFNVGTEKFYYRSTQDEFSGYHAFWDLRPCVELLTDDLEDYWENALVAVKSSNNHPLVVWGRHPDDNVSFDVTSYNIYRAINNGSFSKIAEVNESTSDYEDETFTVGGSANAHYKVTANWEDAQRTQQETSATNVATIGVSLYKSDSYSMDQTGYNLFQNYPNPFNPATKITYSIADNSFTTLKVFDVLGREVAELINTYKEAGTHSIEFNGSDLPSGIYFYKIQIDNYIETRKLILQK